MEDFIHSEGTLEDLMASMHQIDTNLYLGNLQAAQKENLLRSENISCIVQCVENPERIPKHDFIEYAFVPIGDVNSASLLPHLPGALRFIHHNISEGKAVLVHCAAGVSRSSSVVISYLMATKNIDFNTAKMYVKSKRRCINPNPGFERQLESLSPQTLQSYLE